MLATFAALSGCAVWLGCSTSEAFGLPGAAESASGCGAPSTAIEQLRGTGSAQLAGGRLITLEGVVTAVRVGPEPRAGFYLQAETPTSSGPAGGIFVVTDPASPPELGIRVRVRGQLGKAPAQPELMQLELLQRCGNSTLQPEPFELPVSGSPELWDRRWVRALADWVVIDNTEVASSGKLTLSSTGRRYASGHELGGRAPVDDEAWTLEGLDQVLPEWIEADEVSQHLRLGAQCSELRAVVLSASEHRLLASGPPLLHAATPSAPTAPAATSIRVAALNLDNYFVALGARGARTLPELSRQRDKLTSLLAALDADVLGLSELQNTADTSLSDLILALNARLGGERSYRFEDSGDPGADALRTGIAYRATRVTATSPARFASAPEFRRPPLFQSFEAGTLHFTLGVVHLKSKRCDDGPELIGPEGCGADARTRETAALLRTLDALPGSPQAVLLAGDFNSDPLEAPSQALEHAGLVDLLDGVPVSERYSYAFDGQLSQLDHAFATSALAPALVRAAIWHVDADEPRLLGYELANPPGAYRPDARRASDHDPVLVDLSVQ